MKIETLTSAIRRYADLASPFQEKQQIKCDFSIVEIENGRQILISLDEAMSLAADELDRRDIDGLKFRFLVNAMKERGMADIYQRMMGEKIPDF